MAPYCLLLFRIENSVNNRHRGQVIRLLLNPSLTATPFLMLYNILTLEFKTRFKSEDTRSVIQDIIQKKEWNLSPMQTNLKTQWQNDYFLIKAISPFTTMFTIIFNKDTISQRLYVGKGQFVMMYRCIQHVLEFKCVINA